MIRHSAKSGRCKRSYFNLATLRKSVEILDLPNVTFKENKASKSPFVAADIWM